MSSSIPVPEEAVLVHTGGSNPDGVAVTVGCVDPGTLTHVEYRKADGRNWEEWFERSNIAGFSKGKAGEAAAEK
ncbi:unnamed protein product [Urochloa humidicola]